MLTWWLPGCIMLQCYHTSFLLTLIIRVVLSVLCGGPKKSPRTFTKAAKSATFDPLNNVLLELMFLISKNTDI